MVSLLTSAVFMPPGPTPAGPCSPHAEHTPTVLREPGTPRPDTQKRRRQQQPLSRPPEGQCPRQTDRTPAGVGRGELGRQAVPSQPPARPASRCLPGSICSGSGGQVWASAGRPGPTISPRAPKLAPRHHLPGITCPAAATSDDRILDGEEPQDSCLSSAENALPVGHTVSQLSTPFFFRSEADEKG